MGLFDFLKKKSNDPLGTKNTVSTPEADSLCEKAIEIVFRYEQASASLLQRYLQISFSNANYIIEKLEHCGIVSHFDGMNPREILAFNIEDAKTKLYHFNTSNNYKRHSSSSIVNLSDIDNMEGHDFEYWCADLLQKNGYENVEVTPGSGDQGIDVLAERDGIKYAIQCKCYSHDLGNTPVQEAEAGRVFYGCHVGVVMTNRYFTKGAKELAEKTRTILWDRDKLEKMLERQ